MPSCKAKHFQVLEFCIGYYSHTIPCTKLQLSNDLKKKFTLRKRPDCHSIQFNSTGSETWLCEEDPAVLPS
ncbi:hypothetical protein AALO_G00027740 [Alosa alosa]|uniref:Uncharacterized protein n=1 Tax=Alosa alosa TaxID=278164 RepID=A0AAV6HBR1_9TELE|nr:hypothetical protein AALO_G00027740 [Alosa alosa]